MVTSISEKNFYIKEISNELMERMRGKSFKENCSVPRDDLRYLHVLHRTLDGKTLEGEMICNKHIADAVLHIFREFYEADYPVERVRLVDEYDADDDLSMAANNSSSFNFRLVSGTSRISKHGLGMAVDINPLYNPYIPDINEDRVLPESGRPYIDREADFPYKITREDLAFKLFKKHGFNWGGDWDESPDYQHFEIPTNEILKYYPDYLGNR